MRVVVPKETLPGERRVALLPESVKRLVAKQFEVMVERDAGATALATDADYANAGARIVDDLTGVVTAGTLVVAVRPPQASRTETFASEAALLCMLDPMQNLDLVERLAKLRITAFAADMVPRTTAAQMMDVLSSQSTLAGYRAVLLAAELLPRFFPMLMTAAGTIAPARVIVVGAGVAGLQAIGTARRLGAVVEAFDVRRAAKEQVESLGARFIDVEGTDDAQTATGYAREPSEDDKRKQSEALAKRLAGADVCITTALIPGRPAPKIVTEAMVRAMKPGAVVIDIAAEQGGNCALTRRGETVHVDGVAVVGAIDLPSAMAPHASQMYSRNVERYVLHLVRDGALAADATDEITRGTLVTHAGRVVHPRIADRIATRGAA